jgi:hypothetical protein
MTDHGMAAAAAAVVQVMVAPAETLQVVQARRLVELAA